MKRGLVLLLALGVCAGGLILTGCGGGTETVTVTSSSGGDSSGESAAGELQRGVEEELAEEETGIEKDQSEESDCGEKEIDSGAFKEGTCSENGTKIVVANMHSPLKLETLAVELKGVDEKKSISSLGETETASGIYVSFELEVKNLTHVPAEFREEQTVLVLDENIYTQNFEVQNGFEQNSFMWQGKDIQPQGVETGTVTFDIPPQVARNLTANGNLDVINFGAETFGEGEEFFEQDEYGVIRTYK